MKEFFKKVLISKTFINSAIIALTLAGFLFLGVFVVTRHFIFDAYFLGDKGTLGDAVNGLSAPFISFFSAILIYITFKEQNKANHLQLDANKLLQSQWQFDTALKLFNDVEQRIMNVPLYFDSADDTVYKHTGLEALDLLGHKSKTMPIEYLKPNLEELTYFFIEFDTVIQYVHEAEIPQKPFLEKKLSRFFEIKLRERFVNIQAALVERKDIPANYTIMYDSVVVEMNGLLDDELKRWQEKK